MFKSAKTKMERGWVNRGGVMNSLFFGWGVGPPLGPLPDVFRLGRFKHELSYIFAEISKNGLGSIPLKVHSASRKSIR
jgi:hypothetical protein